MFESSVRHAARGLLVTPQRELLLLRMAFPWTKTPVWVAPGGGLERDETWEAALARELREETGHELQQAVRQIWQRQLDVTHEGHVTQLHERYFLIETERFEPAPAALDARERGWFLEFRWWPLADIPACAAIEEGAELVSHIERELTSRAQYRAIATKLDPGARVTAHRELFGGISAQTVAVDWLESTGSQRTVVVRRFDRGTGRREPRVVSSQFQLLGWLHAQGLPVPEPLMLDHSCTLLPDPYIVMSHLHGSARYDAPDRAALVHKLSAQLARIHACELDDIGFVRKQSSWLTRLLEEPCTPKSLPYYGEFARQLLLRADCIWKPQQTCLLHGDFWLGNILWSDDEIVGVIDWEDALTGDPLFDVAIARLDLAWTFDAQTAQDFTRAYAAHTNIDLTDLPYWDLVAALRPGSSMTEWATPWADVGRPDITAASMSQARAQFARSALVALGVSYR